MAKEQMDLNQTQENQLSLRSRPLSLHLYLKKHHIAGRLRLSYNCRPN